MKKIFLCFTIKQSVFLEEVMLKIGIVGTGHMGKYHINTLSMIPGINFCAICDINEAEVKSLGQKYGVKAYTDYESFLHSVDAVIIAVPTYLHYKYASTALVKGKHVLVEKPITKTLYFAEKLFNLAVQKKLVLQVGHVERFNAAVQELTKIVQKPYLIQAQRMGPQSRIRDVGVVLDLMIHDVDIVLSLARSPVTHVEAYGERIYSNFEDVATAILSFENGVVASITASRVTQAKMRHLAVSQQDAYIFLNYDTQEITITRQPQAQYEVAKEELKYRQESLVERVFVHRDNALKLEQQHFIDCILNNRTPLKTPEEDLAALDVTKQITDKIYHLWRNR